MIYHSHYWIDAIALEPFNNHEIAVLEKEKDSFTIRHAKCAEDWLYNQSAYINTPTECNVSANEHCRCLIVDVTMK